MLDEKALILIAHSDRRTLVSLYTLLDAEGYFVAPCFSMEDLLKYCGQYKPELVMTTAVLPDDQEGRLLEAIQKRSPETRILLLPNLLGQGSCGAMLDEAWSKEILRVAEGLPVADPPIHLNGF
jgi:DNA-binding NtrC family response regulator